MRLLLDEDVPVQLLDPLRRLLPGHQIDHTEQLGWKGKKDRFLLPDARRRGYDALLTHDSAQLDSAEECRAIRDSRMHHVRYHQNTRSGLDGFALAMASVMAASGPEGPAWASLGGRRAGEVQREPTAHAQVRRGAVGIPPVGAEALPVVGVSRADPPAAR